MTRKSLIESLLAAAESRVDDEQRREARMLLRAAWAKGRIAALKAAQRRADAAWMRLLDSLPEDHDVERDPVPDPPEQAEVDAIQAELDAVRHHDRWPKELHWPDV